MINPCTILIMDPDKDKTLDDFGEFFIPIYESDRGDIVDVDNTSVITFYDEADIIVMNLKFGDRISIIEPPHDWVARARPPFIKK
jgi:hypothetical protein